MNLCFGYKKSRMQAPLAHDMLRDRAKYITPLPLPDQTAFVGTIFDQGRAGACTGMGTTGAFDQYQRANGIAEPILASPLFFYQLARLQEYAGEDPATIPPLEDTGAEPDLLCRAANRAGYVSWQACPYPVDPAVLSNDAAMAKIVNAPVAPTLMEQAYDLRGLRWHTIPVGTGALDMIATAVQHRLAVCTGMFVDTGYMGSAGRVVTAIDTNDPDGGGHYQACVAVSGTVLKIRSSWGPKTGKYGFYYLDRKVLEDPSVVSEILVLDFAAPVPS